jgi:hypothetical protein
MAQQEGRGRCSCCLFSIKRAPTWRFRLIKGFRDLRGFDRGRHRYLQGFTRDKKKLLARSVGIFSSR